MGKPKKERNLKQIDGKWYIDFTFDKKRIRQFGGYTKEQARNTLAKIRIQKLDEKMGYKKLERKSKKFMEFARDEFIENYSKVNKKSWGRDVSSLKALEPYFKGKMIHEITPKSIEKFKAQRLSGSIAPGTVNRELAFLNTMFKKAVEWDDLDSSPMEKVRNLRVPPHKDRILTRAEITRLLGVSNSHLKPVLIIALNTAMRMGEILKLEWENVYLMKRQIHVGDSKSGRSRDIPMNDLVVEALSVLSQDTKYVFPSPKTDESLKSVKSSFKRACRKAKIKGLRFHDLRHTAATIMIEIGVPLVTVSEILGHASIQMTMRYAHPRPEHKRDAIFKLGNYYEESRQKVDTVDIKKPASVSLSDN